MSNVLKASAVLVVLSAVHVAQGAEFEVHPSLAVSEEYTDNVFETGTNRQFDYITRVLPGLAMSYKAPALTGDLSYVLDYRYYARNTQQEDIAHALSAKAKLTAVENLLFLDVSDDYQRVSLNATRDTTQESLFVNQEDRNVAMGSPYLVIHPTENFMVKSGYRFIDTRYVNKPENNSPKRSTTNSSAIDKMDHVAFLNLTYELSKRFSLTADYTFTRELTDADDYSQHQALGGFRYEYAEKSFVFAQAGNAWTRYSTGKHLDKVVWNAGITHVVDTVTATVTTGVRYIEDPLQNTLEETFVSGIIEKRFDRGSLSLSPMYSEYVQTTTDDLQTKKWGGAARGRYDFTADLNGSLGVTAEKYEEFGSYTRRIMVESGLSYNLASKLTVSLNYIYTGYYSPGNRADNWHSNRGIIEIKKTF